MLLKTNTKKLPVIGYVEKHTKKKMWKRIINERELWIISIILLMWVGIFAYYPMYGVIIAFKKYIPGQSFSQAQWVGLKYFIQFFNSNQFPLVIRNTLAISGLNLLFGFPAPIILALLINEVRRKHWKRFVQTVSYVPHFISWVVVASLIFSFLGNEGLVNTILQSLNITTKSVCFLNEGKYFWGMITAANIWKEAGWGSIIYLSAIAGIDEELYQAGAVDGLGRLGTVWHIILPGISSTIVLLWILGIGDILNAGFEQQLLLGNDLTRDYYEVIDTFAYKYGVQRGIYSYGTAVSLMKGVISVSLVFFTNWFTRKKLDIAAL